MPKETDDCNSLYEEIPNRGRWSALSKYSGIYDHVDLYGAKPDKSLEGGNLKMRRKLNQATPCWPNTLRSKQYNDNHVKVERPLRLGGYVRFACRAQTLQTEE